MNNYIGKHAVVKKGLYRDHCGKVVQQHNDTFQVTLEMVADNSRQTYRITDLIFE
jgi:hypothetical protein